ncbi:MAG: PIG-L family deacetylase, partial [Anaerolineales bacterium]|nr:PIG-L family deacetylase [Anaerolineales bacterium]
EALGKIREAEMLAAGKALGLSEVTFLDYIDGELDEADTLEITARLSKEIRRIRPQVVVTFPLDGAYGHPDHVAISQFALGAIVHASSPRPQRGGLPPHQVQKFYYSAWDRDDMDQSEAICGDLIFEVDGAERASVAWEPWVLTTEIDTADYWETVEAAVACHQSQLQTIPGILELGSPIKRTLWSVYKFVRVFSLVNGGRKLETDLFTGLR